MASFLVVETVLGLVVDTCLDWGEIVPFPAEETVHCWRNLEASGHEAVLDHLEAGLLVEAVVVESLVCLEWVVVLHCWKYLGNGKHE